MSGPSGESVKVAIRVRKLIPRELRSKKEVVWETDGDRIFSSDPKKDYGFDHVFDHNKENGYIYDELCKDIIESAFRGFNGTIFAYGQTSSGKTHTMMGNEFERGVIPAAIDQIFASIDAARNREYLLRVSYLEIYNENVMDLLAHPKDRKKFLQIKDDMYGNVIADGAREENVTSPEDVIQILLYGEQHRHVGETNMNERSSRSHTIFRLIIESTECNRNDHGDEPDGAIMVSHLNLVDLAGSERVGQTGASGERLREGGSINRSLMVLSQVISKLSDGSRDHLPFRDSKLTRILKNSLGGNALTAIICTVTPVEREQTKSTLEFASRARNIVQHARLNEILDDQAQLKRLKKEILALQRKLEEEQSADRAVELKQLKSVLTEKDRQMEAKDREMADEREKLKLDMENQIEQLRLLREKLVSGVTDESSATNLTHKSNEDRRTSGASKKSSRRETWAAGNIRRRTRRMSFFPKIKRDDEDEMSKSDNDELPEIRDDVFNLSNDSKTSDNLSLADRLENSFLQNDENIPESLEDIQMPSFNFVSCRNRRKTVRFVDLTPELSSRMSFDDSIQSESADVSSTPKSVIRDKVLRLSKLLEEKDEAMRHIQNEYSELLEFTRLEEEVVANKEVQAAESLKEVTGRLKTVEVSEKELELMYLDVNKELHEAKITIKDLKSELASVTSGNIEKASLQETISEIRTSHKAAVDDNKKLSRNLKDTEEKLKFLEDEKKDFEFRLELIENKYKKKELELIDSLNDARMLSSERRSSIESSPFGDVTLSAITELTSKVELLQNYAIELEQEVKQNKESAAQKDLEIESFKTKIDEYEIKDFSESSGEDFYPSYKSLIKINEEQKAQILLLKDEIACGLNMVAEEKETIQGLKEKLIISDEVKDALEKKLLNIDEVKEEDIFAIEEHNQTFKNSQISLLNKTAEVDELRSQLATLEKTKEEQISRMTLIIEEKDRELAEMNKITFDNEEQKKELTHLKIEIQNLENKALELVDNNVALKSKHTELEDSKNILLKNMDVFENNERSFKTKIDENVKLIDEKDLCLKELIEEIGLLKGQLETIKHESNEAKLAQIQLNKALEEKEEALIDLSKRFEELDQERSCMQESYNGMHDQINSLKNQKSSSEYEKEILQLTENIEEQKYLINNLEKIEESLEKTNCEKDKEIQNLEFQLENDKKECKQLEGATEMIAKELEKQREECFQLQHSNTQLQSRMALLEEEEMSREEEIAKLKKLVGEKEFIIQRNDDDINEVRGSLAHKTSEVDELKTSISELELRLTDGIQASFNYERVKELEAKTLELNYIINDNATTLESLKLKESHLEESDKKKEALVNKLKLELSLIQNQLSNREDEFVSMKESLKSLSSDVKMEKELRYELKVSNDALKESKDLIEREKWSVEEKLRGFVKSLEENERLVENTEELKSLRKLCDEKTAEIDALNSKLSEMEVNLENERFKSQKTLGRNNVSENLEEIIKIKEEDLKSMKVRESQMSLEISEKNDNIEDLLFKVSSLESQIERKGEKESREPSNESSDGIIKELELIQEQQDFLKLQNKEQEKRIITLDEKKSAMKERILKMHDQNDEFDESVSKDSYCKTIQELNEKIKRIEGELEKEQALRKNIYSEKDTEIQELNDVIREKDMQLLIMKSGHESNSVSLPSDTSPPNKVQFLENLKFSKDNEISPPIKRCEENEDNSKRLGDCVDTIYASLAEKGKEVEELKRALLKADSELLSKNDEKSEIKKQYEKLKSDLKSSKINNASMSVSLTYKETEIGKLQKRVELITDQSNRYKEELRKVKNENMDTTVYRQRPSIGANKPVSQVASSVSGSTKNENCSGGIMAELYISIKDHEIKSLKKEIENRKAHEENILSNYRKWKAQAKELETKIELMNKNSSTLNSGSNNDPHSPLKENRVRQRDN